jgi:FAD/FMN-containing dehydrogenase
MSADDLFRTLLERWGPSKVTMDQGRLAPHLEEWRGRSVGHAPFLAEPASTEEVSELVGLCAEHGVPITLQGGNTGLVLGQQPKGEILLSTRRMDRIRSVDAAADAVIAESGVVLARIQEAAEAAQRLFPLSLGSQGSATIGGLLSTNAGGVHVLRYGMMRDLTLGIEAVLPDGRIVRDLNSLRKNNTGYDLKSLLIGAEGTLGVITAATLRLFPKPSGRTVAMAALNTPDDAIALLQRAKARSNALSAFELMNETSIRYTLPLPGIRAPFSTTPPWTALLEFERFGDEQDQLSEIEDILAASVESGVILDAVVAQTLEAAAAFWRLRETLPAGHRSVGRPSVNHDVSTPVSRVPEFMRRAGILIQTLSPGAEMIAFGHAGDGNTHLTAIAAEGASFDKAAISTAIHDLVADLGGSISAEHGIGVSRKDDFLRYKDPTAVAVMRSIKAALDPKGILNPRVLF